MKYTPHESLDLSDDLPDAQYLKLIEGPKAARIANLHLASQDLEFARECLIAIRWDDQDRGETPIAEALWRCAVIYWQKCFGEGGIQLQITDVYPADAAQDVAKYFRDLRDRYFIHQASPYATGMAVAIVRAVGSPHPIEVRAMTMRANTRDDAHVQQLLMLVERAQQWVSAAFDKAIAALEAELAALPREDLEALPPVSYRVPTVEDLKRPTKSRR